MALLRTRFGARAMICFSLAVGTTACASSRPPRSEPSALLGDIMPSFESKTVNGNEIYSTAFHGNPIVVTFVAAGCTACERTLKAAQATYGATRELVVVGVFRPEDADSALAITSKLEVRFPVVVDQDGAIAKRFKVESVPRTFVVDPNGRVSWVGGKDLSEATLTSAVQAVD